MATALAAIDWRQPWLEPWRAVGVTVASVVTNGGGLPEALNAAADGPVRFVDQDRLPRGTSYEAFIGSTGCCPVRTGVHDFFNGLCWLHFPHTKRTLNRLQAAQIAAGHLGPVRGAVRDGLTLFDENAALLQAPEALWNALQAKDWQRVFVDLRPLWAQSTVVLFGHALLEKLVVPRKAITAHVFRVPMGLASMAALDRWVAGDLNARSIARKPFAHLPILGVPTWWPANRDPSFYADPHVFRQPRPRDNRPTVNPTAVY